MNNMRFNEAAEDLSTLVDALTRLGSVLEAAEDGDRLTCLHHVGTILTMLPNYGQLVQHLGELLLTLVNDGINSVAIIPRVRAITFELSRLIGNATDDINATAGNGVRGSVRPAR